MIGQPRIFPCLMEFTSTNDWNKFCRETKWVSFLTFKHSWEKKHYSVSILVYIFHTPYLWISRVEPSSWRCLQMHHLCICHIGHCTHQILPKKKRALFAAVEKNRKSNHPNKVQSITSWWFQPIWKICSSNWIISPSRGENSWKHQPDHQCQSVDHPKMFCFKKKLK